MKKLRFYFQTILTFSEVISRHSFTLRCIPVEEPGQKLLYYEVSTQPGLPLSSHRDSFGNHVLTGYYENRHSTFSFTVEGEVLRQNLSEDRPDIKLNPLPCYKYFSALTTPEEAIRSLHAACMAQMNGTELNIDQRVWNLSHQVYTHMNYQKYATDIHTTGEEALQRGKGVCQDYAHILLSLLRIEKIPCRYVAGLFMGEGETHGWVEYYNENTGWIGIDPTNDCMADTSYIKISHGRDFRDCSINRGIFCGGGMQTQNVTAKVEEIK